MSDHELTVLDDDTIEHEAQDLHLRLEVRTFECPVNILTEDLHTFDQVQAPLPLFLFLLDFLQPRLHERLMSGNRLAPLLEILQR